MSRRARIPLLVACAAIAAMAGGALALAADPGRGYYVLHCAGCHQSDGTGSASHEIPNMKGTVGRFLHLPEGRAFLVQVPGTSNSALSDAEIAVLLNWMLPQFSRAEMPPGFVPYTADEVTRLRKQRLDDVAGTRAAIVTRLASMGYPVEPPKEQSK